MYGFLVVCGWALAAAVIALAWVGWRLGRRLVTGMVIGAVAGLLWPITLWVGVGALLSQQRRRTAAVRPGFTVATVLGCTIASLATFGVLGAMAPPPAAVPVASAGESTDRVAASQAPEADGAVVTAVVDGDTVDVDIDGRAVRIGMLNIHASELSAPEEDRRCLGPEAAELLSSLIPVGSSVTLEYDEVRTDRDARTLAGVFTEGGVLVNAEIARAGLADAVVDGNARFLPAVESAQREAAEAGRGLYGTESPCTLPGRTHAVTTAFAAVPAAASLPAGATADDIDRMAGDVARVVALAAATRDGFTAARHGVLWDVYSPQEHDRFAAEATAARESALRAESELRAAATAARTREADAARAAEEQAAAARAEAARAEAARAEAARAEETREAERRRAAAAPERPAPAASADTPAPSEGTGGGRVVHPGSFCDKAGASGVTTTGKPMRCQLDSKGERLRWKSA